MISYALDLNLIPGGVLPRIDLSQYDHGQSVECDLYNGPVPYTIPSGSVAYVEGTKPDKTGFQYEATIATNKVTFEVTNQMTACGGEVVTELVLTHSGDRIATINFILNVEPAALANDTIISETDLPIVQQIPEYVEEIAGYAEEAEAWANGGEEGTPSATNNAKYWAEKSQEYAIGAFHWKNKVAFANLPTSDLTVGDVYEVSDAFTTDSRFSEGAGVKCEAGTEIVWTNGNKWSVLTPPGVTSFNGRKGAVTPAIGDYSASQISSSAIAGQTDVEGALSAISSSLSDKVSKAGDTMTGALTIKRANPTMNFSDMNNTTERRRVWQGFANSGGDFYLYDGTNSRSILIAKANGEVQVNGVVVPSGGTIKKTTSVSVSVTGTASFSPFTKTGQGSISSGNIISLLPVAPDASWIVLAEKISATTFRLFSNGSGTINCIVEYTP